MIKCHCCLLFLLLLPAYKAGWAQDNSAQPQEGAVPPPPVPAYGQSTDTRTASSENPPISGLDMPNLEPHAAPLSYLQAGAHFSETADSNIQNSAGQTDFGSITKLLGSLDLQRLWSHYSLGLDYLGGVGYYNASGIGLKQIEELGFEQKITWKRGEFSVRDAFSYQPEGSFGSSYGGVGLGGAGLGEESVFFGSTVLGELGQVPRIMNLSLADFEQYLTPKSAITATAGYGFIHFLENDPVLGNPFIGSSQTTAQVGYDRIIGPHDQAALAYGYERFDFSTGEMFQNHLVQLMWGHRISGRMDLFFAGGPQFTEISGSALQITGAGRATLRYRFSKASLNAAYAHFLTTGSGLFAGATSDIAHVSAARPLTRRWTGFADIGYSHNTRVLPAECSLAQVVLGQCPGVSGNTYQYGFAGGGARRNLGREFAVYGSYQFNYLLFDQSFCATSTSCSRTSGRQTVTVGLDWIPRPWRLD
jgi:hypothetical protein